MTSLYLLWTMRFACRFFKLSEPEGLFLNKIWNLLHNWGKWSIITKKSESLASFWFYVQLSRTPCMVDHWALWLTFCLAGLSYRVHLVTFIAFTFKIPLVVDADLATSIRILTLINVCREEREERLSINWKAERDRHRLAEMDAIHPH